MHDAILKIREILNHTDAVIVGASNGFSMAEGLDVFAGDEAFHELFPDFVTVFGFRNILDGCFFDFPTDTSKWAYWSRLIHRYSGNYDGSPVMDALKTILGDLPYFIVTSNPEAHFELAGFDPERIFNLEGTWEHMQCQDKCHDGIYPLFELASKMTAEENGDAPSDLCPRCPECNGPMIPHVAVNRNFIKNEDGQRRFTAFYRRYTGQNIAILELGVGYRNQLIKAPLMQLALREPNAAYITLNAGEIHIPDELSHKAIGIDARLDDVLPAIAKEL